MNGERGRVEADALIEMALAIASGRPLAAVLRRLLGLAVELTRASRAAMIPIDAGGRVLHVILSGTDGELPSPATAVIVRALLHDTRSTRLQGLTLPSVSLGFPAGDPPVTSLVGSQMRVLDRCYGCTYLVDKRGGSRFTADDERLVAALAALAGMALAHLHVAEDDRLHDDVAQTLFGVGMEIEAVAQRVAEDDLAERLRGSASNLDVLIDRLRHHDERSLTPFS